MVFKFGIGNLILKDSGGFSKFFWVRGSSKMYKLNTYCRADSVYALHIYICIQCDFFYHEPLIISKSINVLERQHQVLILYSKAKYFSKYL